MESRLRSWAKSVTWRLVGIVVLGGISYAITRDWSQTTTITIIFHTLRLIMYYYHERIWERISWGKPEHPLARHPVRKDISKEDHDAVRRLLEERNCLIKPPDYQI